jgi:hypothetical protein
MRVSTGKSPAHRELREPRAHHPRAEAAARLHGRHTVRVLEPSPPAISSPPYAADDPTARASSNERTVVSPVVTGDLGWTDVVEARGDPALAAWCRDRWLADWRPLRTPAPGWERAVTEHRALASEVLGPWRAVRSGGTGHRSLRATFGGYGTPFCWDDQQLRMDGPHLVFQRGAEVAALVPDDLSEAAMFAGSVAAGAAAVPTPAPGVPGTSRARGPGHDDRLELDPELAADIADWVAFGTLVFERFRARTGVPARVQLDPDRFAVELELRSGRLRLPLFRPGIELAGEVIVPGPMLSERDDHVALVDRILATRLGVSRTPPSR